ncbi:YgiQ family radical SAM protein [Huintestinicola sp.]|jgi:radical SAM protein YgiQ|uniref:YgiQ family radical SAM protein n=1 Tax=Huintestinicola sp. TaxID=2981661 RepID=UPI00307B2D57
MPFLPISKEDMAERNISQLDFICITGDSYVDHPSFGISIISRMIEDQGFTVGIIAQPDWHSDRDFTKLGRPKYAFLITAGNIDSMVAHYTAAKKKRSDDAYTAGGKAGKRPDRAAIVYSKAIKRIYGDDMPVALGGLEASLRRFAHYDYWDDAVRPSILEDSGADLLMYGMSEHQIVEICNRLAKGENIHDLRDIRGTAYLCDPKDTPLGAAECPSLALCRENKEEYAKACKIQYDWQDEVYGKTVIQRQTSKMLVQLPPALSLTTPELDHVYELPYMRTYHPIYEAEGGVPGIKEVEFSITHNRGCFGNCNFCSIALHQGRRISVRSKESILREAKLLTTLPNFKGYIHDVGGPTANFRAPSCTHQLKYGLCKGRKCLAPEPCKNLEVNHEEYLDILREIRKIKGVKRVFIRSGIRYDYLIEDENDEFMRELIEYHVSGQLKVAPEHCSAAVLDMMGKPHIEAYRKFQDKFYKMTGQIGKEQYLVPYLMSSHPGSTLKEAVELAQFLKSLKMRPEQVQDFYPTPGTISTCMFYTELDPYTMKKVYVPKTAEEKGMQRALLQYFKPENRRRCIEALIKAHRTDLIGMGKDCLVKPDEQYSAYLREKAAKQQSGKGSQAHNKPAHGKAHNNNSANRHQANNSVRGSLYASGSPLASKGRNDRWQKEDQRKKKH